MPRLLILQLKRIGDAILTAPVLGALRQACPEARITLVLAGAAGRLAPLFAAADEVIQWQDRKLNLPVLLGVRKFRPDMVLDFTGTDRSALLAICSAAPVRTGYGKSPGGLLRQLACNITCAAPVRSLHTIDFHHALAASAGLRLPPVPDAGHLSVPPGITLPSLPPSWLLVHPGTAREEKFWPARQWSQLLDHLHRLHGLPLVLTGGDWEVERRHIRQILSGTSAPVIDLSGRLDLPQLAALIAGARLAVTVDTAAMHLAAAFRVPQAALFGPTNPFHWAPRHRDAVFLHAGTPPGTPPQAKQPGQPMSALPWRTVAEAVARLLATSPPGRRTGSVPRSSHLS